MPTSTRDLIALARQLRQNYGDEAGLRCAVSRSYYAALHRADQVFPVRDPSARRIGEGTHEQIIARAQAYGNGVNPGRIAAQTVAKLMPKMKRTRVKADYHLDEDVSAQECDDAIQRAEFVIGHCEQVVLKMHEATMAPPIASPARPALIRIR